MLQTRPATIRQIPDTPRCLGVLGGMGPMAGAQFALRLVQLTPAGCDQEHIPLALRNDPRIPDRSAALMAGGADPLPAMLEGIAALQVAGADCIAIPCNTAHLWFKQLREASKVPLFHIVDAVVQDLQRQGMRGLSVGVLGTPATLACGLYQNALKKAGHPVLVLEDDDFQDCVDAIALVKANEMPAAFTAVSRSIRKLLAAGARAIVLGCTELPLAVPHERRAEFDGVVLTDSIDALAKQVLSVFRPSLRLLDDDRHERIAP
ncbi:amino acid racemase [Variovorax sp. J31P207]|uniref:aspartate/glutamate racemase family protein n=1 Tax=Variovorax sp. J31P207 TaxID=3053510 RepID=UPI002577A1B7|nr:amino acid racemase [Variovorax sp. J31P207]MDM0071566.1 amino acid racemase [Variovorax sp. J31P207]